jgi:uncharacterized protein
MFNVGVISDTHGLLRPEAVEALKGSDHILHAGDIGAPGIVAELQKIAPVDAIRGNIDVEPWALSLPLTLTIKLAGAEFLLIHNRAELPKLASGVAAVIFGHSHQPAIEKRGKVLFFNPGSAGPRRFKLPVSVGRIRVENGVLRPELVPLG